MPFDIIEEQRNQERELKSTEFSNSYELQCDQTKLINVVSATSTDEDIGQLKSLSTKSLTLYTHNIWFENFNFSERNENLIKLIEDSDADFICLQEVTSSVQKDLLS
jgi:hypothetical protein